MKLTEKQIGSKICVVLIGNKSDLGVKREVSLIEGYQFAMERGWPFFEMSALTSKSVMQPFQAMLSELY